MRLTFDVCIVLAPATASALLRKARTYTIGVGVNIFAEKG
jgi:hypothetical protein